MRFETVVMLAGAWLVVTFPVWIVCAIALLFVT